MLGWSKMTCSPRVHDKEGTWHLVQQCGNMELYGAEEEYTSGFGYVENTC